MLAMRQIIEDTKDRIPVPPEFHHRRTEVVLMTIDDEQQITPYGTDKFEDYKEDYEMYESQVDSLIELITRFTDEEGSGDIYHRVVETVINKLKKVESPDESLESVSDAWEFLGAINYYGSDHGLYDVAISDLKSEVLDAIEALPLYEQFFLITHDSDSFDWQDCFKENGKGDVDHLLSYATKDDPLYECIDQIVNYIKSQAPKFTPYE